MAVTVQSVVDRVQVTLQDTTGVRWPVTAELVTFVNDAQREIALLKPDATAVNTTITLSSSSGTKQSIPTDGNRLLNVVRNKAAASDSSNGGRAIRLVKIEELDAQHPDWHSPSVTGDAAHTNIVRHFVYDERNPRNFYVYPGIGSTAAYIELVYSQNPATIALNANLGLPDIFANAVMDYVLYRCYIKDAESAGNSNRANTHYSLFLNSITGKGMIDTVTSPNAESRAQPLQARV